MSLSMSMESGWFSHQAICWLVGWLVGFFLHRDSPSKHAWCLLYLDSRDRWAGRNRDRSLFPFYGQCGVQVHVHVQVQVHVQVHVQNQGR